MPTSNYMPSLVVEIAWDGGFRVPMADWTWTDVSDYVELDAGLSITGGRGDERSTADANTLSLTFDNSDGRFTAARSTSPYYPNVVLYKPIRVLATPVDGTESARFTGYITSWPVEWEDTSAYAKVTISAASRLARLGLNARWRSLVEETILADEPVSYYPLGDPEGSTHASDVSGNGGAPLVMVGDGTDVVFGQATGPGTDDLTAATFAAPGKILLGSEAHQSYAGISLDAFFLTSTTPSSPIFFVGGRNLSTTFGIGVNSSGNAIAAVGGTLTSTTNICDGNTHHLALTWDGTTGRLYVDGVQVQSGAAAGSPELGETIIGGNITGALPMVVAHVAQYGSVLSAGRIADHATAGFAAYAGETTDARFERYAELAGIPAAEVNAEAGSTTVVHVDTTGQNVVDMLRLVEATEAGVMFDDRDGTLTLHNRAHRYGAASALTLDMALHEVEADYSPRLDPSSLLNDITVTGVTTAHLKPTQAELDANGLATASLTTASDDDDEPLNLASWARLQFAEPKPRVPSLSVDATAQVNSSGTVTCADVMAVTIGDRITVANHPSQASVSITDYIVEGWTETYGHESLKITWNVSPSSPDDQVLIIDDPIRGVIDTNVIGL